MAPHPPRTDMSVADACAVLGVRSDAAWADIRAAYRSGMRRNHPDLTTGEGATARAARLNAAFAVLAEATDRGRRPAGPTVQPSQAHLTRRPERTPTLEVPAGDVFVRVLEAAYDIGDVSYIDPEAGLIQLLLADGGPAASQLLIVIDESVVPATASFTLDSMDADVAPDIRDVVGRLSTALTAAR
ncbi:MAG: DnaJ family molecular chaperone [Acidimicrobiales bacterium]